MGEVALHEDVLCSKESSYRVQRGPKYARMDKTAALTLEVSESL